MMLSPLRAFRAPLASAALCLSLLAPLCAQEKPHISGAAVLTLTKEFLAAAPKRFNGSPGHAAAEKFIESHFEPEQRDHRLDVDTFTATTPAGLQTMHNIIVKFPSNNPQKKDSIILLATHYETNYPLRDINFVGANDGACTSALLIAIGQYYRAHPPQGSSVWLLFDDGEEAVKAWSSSDSLYGTRHLAAKWSQEGVLPHIKALLLADMIGYKDLNIDHDDNSSPALLDMLKVAAKNTGHANAIYRNHTAIEDDTVPFKQRGVPVLDIIDIDYGPPSTDHPEGSYHHTAGDTIDKLSAKSLQTAGDLFLEMIRLVDEH